MFYEVKFSAEECDLLASLVGQPLERVATDGWTVELDTGLTLTSVIPLEVATPDAEHPCGDVERPLVQAGAELLTLEHANVVGEKLGVIRAVKVISTLIRFSPVVDCPPEEIRPGILLPASQGCGWLYFPPTQRQQAEQEVGRGALIDLDIAFELITDVCSSLVVYTRGFFARVNFQGPPAEEEWVKLGAYVRRTAG